MRHLFIISLLFLSGPAFSEIYKWTDANGKVHYSDKGVGNGEPIKLTKPQPTTPESKAKLQNLQNQLKGNRELKEEKAIAEQKAAADLQVKCDKRRQYLKNVEDAGVVYEMREGERVYLDYKEKDEYMARVKNEIREYCD
jgi:hypothetical protein